MSTDAEQSSREDAERFFGSHTTAAPVSALPELAPVKVRQGEIGHDAGLWWGLNAPRWAQGLLSQEAFDYAAAHAAGILIPIARRYAERIAQRTAEIVLAKLEERR